MRCSSCEPLLDRYVECTLLPAQMRRITDHLRRCTACSGLAAELRVVDALLETTPTIELAPNFTFAVMAEVRAAKLAQPKTRSMWAMLAFYLITAWALISTAFALFGPRIAAFAQSAEALRATFASGFDAVAGTAQSLGPATPAVVGVVGVVLALDVVLGMTIVFYYYTIRPRLTARLAHSEVVS